MSVIPAALLAAGFVFGAAAFSEGEPASQKATSRVAKGGAVRDVAHKKKAHKKKARRKKGPRHKSSVKAQRKVVQAPDIAPYSAHTALYSMAVERIALETLSLHGPFLPLETYDYPRPSCSELDSVLEAHVHETDEETPESADVARTVDPVPVSPITRVARTLGSLLRPKSAQSTVRPEDVDLSDLLSAGVQIPVEGVDASRLQDSFLASRGRHRQHLAIDIGAPKGTPVLAAADGEVIQLRRERRGGISLYQKDASGRYLLFYCHLTKYVQGMRPGQKVSKGEVIAYVGRTGHVIGGSHLHFSITRLPEDDDNFKAGVAVNPYLLFLAAPGSGLHFSDFRTGVAR
jgi:murein DD-endopeptidase MepM/ murein hydrolase activator NlpD